MVMRVLGWVVVALSSLLVSGSSVRFAGSPEVPPAAQVAKSAERLIRLQISVDDEFVALRGADYELFVREIVAIHNIEWRRLRHEWFEIAGIEVVPASGIRDASWVLANHIHRTTHEPDTIHVRITGEPLETYGGGVTPRAVGGLAFRGSDTVVISATRGVNADLAAYYLFHEIGHCWDAFDLPFGGGHSTFGSKRFATFDVDAGNGQIMEDSRGPRPRDTPNLAPAFIRARLLRARAAVRDPEIFRRLHDLLLHEPSPINGAYVAKRRKLLRAAGADRAAVSRILKQYEVTPRQARAEADSRREVAEQYWIANDAIRRGDVLRAEIALAAIDRIQDETHADAHLVVAAVGRKIRSARP